MQPLCVHRLGQVGYEEALELQRQLVEERRSGRIVDTLLLLEHPHVLTVGVRRHSTSSRRPGEGHPPGAGNPNIIADSERLAAAGVAVYEAGRGGDVTYHGPGQIVGYPILDLRPDRQDVHRYVRDLEDVLIRTCSDFAVAAQGLPGLTGAWVNQPAGGLDKVAAIGVRISRWITSHGFALNVNTNLDFFRLIVPCGIADRGVTSLQALTGRPVAIAAVEDRIIEHFAEVFDREQTTRPSVRAAVAGLKPTPSI